MTDTHFWMSAVLSILILFFINQLSIKIDKNSSFLYSLHGNVTFGPTASLTQNVRILVPKNTCLFYLSIFALQEVVFNESTTVSIACGTTLGGTDILDYIEAGSNRLELDNEHNTSIPPDPYTIRPGQGDSISFDDTFCVTQDTPLYLSVKLSTAPSQAAVFNVGATPVNYNSLFFANIP